MKPLPVHTSRLISQLAYIVIAADLLLICMGFNNLYLKLSVIVSFICLILNIRKIHSYQTKMYEEAKSRLNVVNFWEVRLLELHWTVSLLMIAIILFLVALFQYSPTQNLKGQTQVTIKCDSTLGKNIDSLTKAITKTSTRLDSIAVSFRTIRFINDSCPQIWPSGFDSISAIAIKDNTAHLDSIAAAIRKSSFSKTSVPEKNTSQLVCNYILIAILMAAIIFIVFNKRLKWWEKVIFTFSLGGITLLETLTLVDKLELKIADTIYYKPNQTIGSQSRSDTINTIVSTSFIKEAELKGFKDADTIINDSAEISLFKNSIKNLCDQANSETLVSVWILGSSDKRDLKRSAKKKYRTNTNLALLRAEAARRILINQTSPEKRNSLASKILIIPTGAIYVGNNIDSSLLAKDRSVIVYALRNIKK